MNKILSAAIAAGTLAAAFVATANAATLSADKRFVIQQPVRTGTVPNLYHPGAKTTFFSNLGTKYPNGVYYPFYSYTVSGGGSVLGFQAWAALAFTPATSGSITEVAAGVGYEEGTNEIAIVVYSDNGGVPGTALKTWKIKNIIPAPECCALAVGKDAAGIPVTAGTQYWVSVQPVDPNSTTFAVWNTNTTDEVTVQTAASWYNGAWSSYTTNFVPAVGVYGK
jgi:hypothetical protein